MERLVQVRGDEIAAYGWYVSFHQRARQHGIYTPTERILDFACHVFSDIALPTQRKIEIAFQAILRHELFHFEVDCMAANWELALEKAVYLPARRESWNRESEEALANAYMLRGFRYPERTLRDAGRCFRAFKAFCTLQPEGYRDRDENRKPAQRDFRQVV